MRVAVLALVVAVVVALGGCELTAAEGALDPGDDDAGEVPECATAADCVLAATTCCGCGEYAMPDIGLADSCDDVECPDPDPSLECPGLVAACVDGVCTAACEPAACDLVCPDGFAADAAGCLSCACGSGPPEPPECTVDTDCVEVPADCCGCARGGADTAVPVAEAGAFGESLRCPSDPGDAACPEVDVCDPALSARCEQGRCTLSDGTGEDLAPTCGHPDLPPCPEGTVCVLNADDDASTQGLGSCQPN